MPRRPNQADSSLIIRSRIAALAVAGWSTRRISEDVDLSRHTVRRWIARSELGELRTVRPGRARVTTEAEDDAIRQNANELRFVSSVQIQKNLGLGCGVRTIRRRLHEGGMHKRRPARKIILTPDHAAARLAFCQQNIDRDWSNVIFTDEKSFSTSQETPVQLWRANGTRYDVENVLPNKTSGRINAGFWGWMSKNGPGEITRIVPPRFNSIEYIRVLEDVLLPSVRAIFPEAEMENIVLVQDYCSIHTAQIVDEWFNEHPEIQLLPWPAKSPDLNPIENLWAAMVKSWNDVGFNGVRERSLQELTDHVTASWESFRNSQICDNLVNSMRRRLEECINSNGYYTKY